MNLLQGVVFCLNLVIIVQLITPATAELKVHFLDVNGGDAVLLESEGRTMLIDAGTYNSGNLTRLYLKSLNISSLDSVMITSPEEGRTGAMTNILNATPALEFIDGTFSTSSASYQDILNKIQENQTPQRKVSSGDSVPFTDDVTIDLLFPVNKSGDSVSETLIPRIAYGDVKFLLMGDVPEASGDVKARIIRVADHGSAYGTDPWFLRNVSPEVAIISTGTHSAGILSPATISNLENSGATVYRTDQDGAISVTTDGKSLILEKFRMEPYNTFSIVSVVETRAPTPYNK